MPTNRTRRRRPRLDVRIPDWAARLLAGERPDRRDPEVETGAFSWLIGDVIPGLPPYESAEARRLIARAGGWPEPPELP